jgi:transposase InsO family protein
MLYAHTRFGKRDQASALCNTISLARDMAARCRQLTARGWGGGGCGSSASGQFRSDQRNAFAAPRQRGAIAPLGPPPTMASKSVSMACSLHQATGGIRRGVSPPKPQLRRESRAWLRGHVKEYRPRLRAAASSGRSLAKSLTSHQ